MDSPSDLNPTERATIKGTLWSRHIAIACTTVLLSAIATILLTDLLSPPSSYCHRFVHPNPPLSPTSSTETASTVSKALTCGNTTSTALAHNCTFDPMSFSWLPAPCTDAHLTAAFLKRRDWTWYFDRDGKRPAPRDEVLRGEHDILYVSAEYHIFHCTYMWRKLHRAVAVGGLVDGYIGAFHHTSHCEEMILEGVEGGMGSREVIDTVIRMKWPDCPVVWG